jgi:hypothetical protein
VFDHDELQRFIQAKAGREHDAKLDRHHYKDSVALLGDAAHGMYLTVALKVPNCCVESCGRRKVEFFIYSYRAVPVPHGHATTDLNLMAHILMATGSPNSWVCPRCFFKWREENRFSNASTEKRPIQKSLRKIDSLWWPYQDAFGECRDCIVSLDYLRDELCKVDWVIGLLTIMMWNKRAFNRNS